MPRTGVDSETTLPLAASSPHLCFSEHVMAAAQPITFVDKQPFFAHQASRRRLAISYVHTTTKSSYFSKGDATLPPSHAYIEFTPLRKNCMPTDGTKDNSSLMPASARAEATDDKRASSTGRCQEGKEDSPPGVQAKPRLPAGPTQQHH